MKQIPAIRAHLKRAAAREPEELQPITALLSKQLGTYDRNADDRKALAPEIFKECGEDRKSRFWTISADFNRGNEHEDAPRNHRSGSVRCPHVLD